MRRSLLRIAAVMLLPTLAAVGCGDPNSSTGSSVSTTADAAVTTTSARLSGEIIVSAAASLTGTFTTIGRAFEREHPGTEVTFNFDSSGALATQIQSGAPADVFASADSANMDKLTAAGLISGDAKVFARNELAIVVKPGNPRHVTGLADLADLAASGVVSLCVETAPCGKYADQILATAGVQIPAGSVTRGQNVKATLTAVASGDADAGIVYATDAKASKDVVTVPIPTSANAIASYPIGVVATTGNAAVAKAFVADVVGSAGRKQLTAAGFLAP